MTAMIEKNIAKKNMIEKDLTKENVDERKQIDVSYSAKDIPVRLIPTDFFRGTSLLSYNLHVKLGSAHIMSTFYSVALKTLPKTL